MAFHPGPLRRWFLLFLACTTLWSCTSTTFMYNRLDFILPWYIDDYADLDGEQEDYLDELLAPFLAWHRAQELPLYVETLKRIEASLDEPATEAGLEETWREFEAAWFRLEDNALDWLLDLGGRLSDEQVKDFLEGLWEEQAEFEEKYLERTDEEFYEDTLDNFIENGTDYLGRLSSEQRTMLEEYTKEMQRSDAAWLADRAEWFEQLAVFLQREPGWQLRVREAVEARRGNSPEQYQAVYDHNLDVVGRAIVELLNSRTEKQDRHLRKKLADLREDLETLVAQGLEAQAKKEKAAREKARSEHQSAQESSVEQ